MNFKANYYRWVLIEKLLLFMASRPVYGKRSHRPNSTKIFLVMKLTTILLFAGFLTASAGGLAQRVTLSANNVKLGKIFKEIKKQTGYVFFYDARVLQEAKPVSIHVRNETVGEVLKEILQGQPLDFSILRKTITIVQKGNRNSTGSQVNMSSQVTESIPPAPVNIINGTVKDAQGNPLAGVSVIVKGTQKGISTNADGSFSVDANAGDVLEFTIVGYQKKSVTVGQSTSLNVVMEIEASIADEVVVVGYGTQKKGDVTGAVSSIKENDIKATPIVALDRALQGRVAGVEVTTNSAKPGGGTTIRVRGTGSVNAGNEPLYVIDGFPTGNLNSINPSDVSSIEILKDASATAIYGSRGSNGVVLITTQRGTAGQSNISLESYYGVQSILHKIPLLNAREYADFINEARINGGGTAYFDGSSPDRPLPTTMGRGTDWQDEVFQQAPIQNYQLSFSGGEQKTRYAISGGYYDQKGIILNSYFKRYSLRANIDREISSRFKIGLTMQGAYTRSNSARTETEGGANSGVTTSAINYAPTFKIYNSDGTYYRDQGPLNGNLVDNPVGLAKELTDRFFTTRLLSNVFADYTILKGLTFKTSWGADLYNTKSNYYATRLIGLGASSGGSASVSSSMNLNWLNENTLTFKTTFSELHSLTVLLGYTTQAYDNENVTARAVNFNDDFASYNNLGAGASLQTPASGSGEWSLISYLARINYVYDNRYLLTLTAREDGSSRFGPNNKYGFFPSGAFAWRVSNEKFMNSLKFVKDLKIRTSYGIAGNQEIGDYLYYSTIQNPSYAFGGVYSSIGSVPSGIGNENLRWEKNAQFDAGIDADLFNSRIQFTADYYIKTTSDLLFSVNVPQTTGYGTALRNIGKVQNKGFEFAVTSQNIQRGDFNWASSFNVAFNRNKVLTLDGRPSFTTGNGIGHLQISNTVLLAVGQALGNFYGRIVDGIFQNEDEINKSAQKSAHLGDIRYKDLNDDGQINDNDRAVIGNGYPKFFGGFNNTFNYKGIELNVFIQGNYGNDILNYQRFELYNLNGNNNQAKDVLNRWTVNNHSNSIPRASATGGGRILSTFHIEDGSYLRVKSISLGYNLSGTLLKRTTLKKVRVYIAAQNIITLTHYTGYDPEVSRFGTTSISQGMDYGGYPSSKTILVGLDLNF